MTYKPTGKTYQLKTYEDFIQLSEDQFAMMLPDFKEWKAIISKLQLVSDYFVEHGIQSEPIELPSCFEWIDDGKHDGDVNLIITDKDNPEKTFSAKIPSSTITENIIEFNVFTVAVDGGDGSASVVVLRNEEDAKKFSKYNDAAGSVYGGWAEPSLNKHTLKLNLDTGEVENPTYDGDYIEEMIKEFLTNQGSASLEEFL